MNPFACSGKARLLGAAAAVSLALLVLPAPAPAAVASGAPLGAPGFDNLPQLAVNDPAKQAAIRDKLNRSTYQTIPFFQSSFTYAGTTYPYQMVGRDPSHPGTSRVRAVVIPIDLTFQDARISNPDLNGSSKLAAMLASPIFQSATWPATGDTTQYADAVRRAEFWNVLKNQSNYHTLLDGPQVAGPVHLTVPAGKGDVEDTNADGVPHGYVDGDWWVQQLQGLLSSLRLSPEQFPVFVTYNVLAGLAGGFHDAIPVLQPNGKYAIFTYAWSSWYDPSWFVGFGLPPDFGVDALVLGHEVAEWNNDPFVDNVVPTWSSLFCSNVLETGDPLEEAQTQLTLNGFTYHLQDEAFFSWFARQTPSEGYAGRYSFLGNFTTYSSPCF